MLVAVTSKTGTREFHAVDLTTTQSVSISETRFDAGKRLDRAAEVRLLPRKCRWGILGPERQPAGIVYMDFVIYQTELIRFAKRDSTSLVSYSIELSLQEDHNNDKAPLSNVLQFTNHFGPRRLRGPERREMATESLSAAVGFEDFQVGIGTSSETEIVSSYWVLSGQTLMDAETQTSKRLRWDLSISMASDQPASSMSIHIGFVIVHSQRPFLLNTTIGSKVSGRNEITKAVIERLKIDPDKGVKSRAILINPDRLTHAVSPLDKLAIGLDTAMCSENLKQVETADFQRNHSASSGMFLSAASRGNLPLMAEILETQDESIKTAMDSKGRTVLSLAAGNGHLEMVNLLLEVDKISDLPDKESRTSLSWAAGNGHVDIVKVLLHKDIGSIRGEAKLRRADGSGRTPLSYAAGNGHFNVLEMLVENLPDLDAADATGKTALAWAAEHGHIDVVRLLLGSYEGKSPQAADTFLTLPMSLAAKNGHRLVMELLLVSGFDAAPDKEIWLGMRLHEAIKGGSLDLVRFLFLHGARVDMKSQDPERTPLGAAAEHGQTGIVPFLLDSGANLEEQVPDGTTPLYLAATAGKEETVKALLDAGANTQYINSNEAVINVMDVASQYPTILRMLSEKDKDGKLAVEDPNPDVSQEFNAKIISFTRDSSGILKALSKGVLVSALLAESTPEPLEAFEDAGSTAFSWFHLPANNMKWVERLMFKHCSDHSAVEKILKPERWVGRQHQGNGIAHHARFMGPLCQSFGPVRPPPDDESCPKDKDMVIFMPYLHWEETDRLEKMVEIIKKGDMLNGRELSAREVARFTKEQRLLYAYIFKGNPHLLHLLHIRRTLDQFSYYHLPSTTKRDQDQTVTRHQKKFSLAPKVLAMVDQLWLWVLVGPSGRADTVISCFPAKDGTQIRSGPDPAGFTDVLQNVMLHMLDEPLAIKTAYDLAGLIASTCSRVFLGPSRAPSSLQFPEIYDAAISNIMNQETELFDVFRALTEYRRPNSTSNFVTSPADDILAILRQFEPNPHHIIPQAVPVDRIKLYYQDTLTPDIPDARDVDGLPSSSLTTLGTEKVREVLQKLGNFHVLDISREITLLREIKDIQDELDIMAMVFKDQTTVLRDMERLCRAIEKPDAVKSSTKQPYPQYDLSDSYLDPIDDYKGMNRISETHRTTADQPAPEGSSRLAPEAEHANDDNPSSRSNVSEDEDDILMRSQVQSPDDDFRPKQHASAREVESVSEIWGGRNDAKFSSLPLVMLQLSIDEIDRMARRAAKANQALDFLVDLKQKQSNVMDARSARIQAEESLKMTIEAGRQGKTIMVFTIVTIVFLPLSFMAAFFAINITQLQRNSDGTLDLGYVLEVMIPTSAVVSLSFIYIAFKAESFKNLIEDFAKFIRR